MPRSSSHILSLMTGCVALMLGACATAGTQPTAAERAPAATPAFAPSEAPAADRAAILAMVGDYKVTFDFTETVSFNADYALKDKKVSGAHEVVRVIADEPGFISLQHILVVGHGDALFPVKHWRQDWQYEPAEVLSYKGGNAWAQEDVALADRAGAWSQTVYQVDDSPRYSGVGTWRHDGGAAVWEAAPSWRPLPRRDATTRDDYHVIEAVNRHAITPNGWVHEQDNGKIVLSGGSPELLVHEVGINTYVKNSDYAVHIATDYWAKTQEFWAEVRRLWDELDDETGYYAVTIIGEPEPLYGPLLAVASDFGDGALTLKDAVAEARNTIAEHTTKTRLPLAARLTDPASSEAAASR